MVSTSLRNNPRIWGRTSSTNPPSSTSAMFRRRRDTGGRFCTRAVTSLPFRIQAAAAPATRMNTAAAPEMESPLPS